MPGGLLNLVAYGNQNIILNGNPQKTFFKTTYAKYSNFGLQKFRIDFDGQRTLRMTDRSVFEFKVPRYADLLMDTYLVVTLPNIWSPVVPPVCDAVANSPSRSWQPFEFRWIDNLGCQMIEEVNFRVGGQLIQSLSGQYLMNMVERDFDDAKKELFYKMTGNTADLNDPANSYGKMNVYPNALHSSSSTYAQTGAEPSIRGRKLYIPLNIWFTLAAKMAFPLVSLQYAELTIEVTIRPVQELYRVKHIAGTTEEYEPYGYYEQTDPGSSTYGFYKFLQTPPSVDVRGSDAYEDRRTNWNADVHLISTYGFLSDDEIRLFASQPQEYLVKEVYTTVYENVVGTKRIDLKSLGMVSSWMWYFQRSDANERNEWSNYTNWAYHGVMPSGPRIPDIYTTSTITCNDANGVSYEVSPAFDLDGNHTGIMYSYNYSPLNNKNIMTRWALLLDGKYRENEQDAGVLSYVEKYNRTSGNGQDGLFCYNFCLHTNPFDFQPSGAMNLSKFSTVEFEIVTDTPTLDPEAEFSTICGPNGDVIGTIKPAWGIYEYTYNMVVMEERYNMLKFVNGMAGLEFSR